MVPGTWGTLSGPWDPFCDPQTWETFWGPGWPFGVPRSRWTLGTPGLFTWRTCGTFCGPWTWGTFKSPGLGELGDLLGDLGGLLWSPDLGDLLESPGPGGTFWDKWTRGTFLDLPDLGDFCGSQDLGNLLGVPRTFFGVSWIFYPGEPGDLLPGGCLDLFYSWDLLGSPDLEDFSVP